MKNFASKLSGAFEKHKTRITWILWIAGLSLLVWGALWRTFPVLDKPVSSEAVKQGVNMKIYTEAQLVSAVSTDRVERALDGMLKTVPDVGFCES